MELFSGKTNAYRDLKGLCVRGDSVWDMHNGHFSKELAMALKFCRFMVEMDRVE